MSTACDIWVRTPGRAWARLARVVDRAAGERFVRALSTRTAVVITVAVLPAGQRPRGECYQPETPS